MLCVTATVPQDIIALPLILLSMQRKVINLLTPAFYSLLPTGIKKDNKSQPINECIVRHEFTHAIIHQVNTAPKITAGNCCVEGQTVSPQDRRAWWIEDRGLGFNQGDIILEYIFIFIYVSPFRELWLRVIDCSSQAVIFEIIYFHKLNPAVYVSRAIRSRNFERCVTLVTALVKNELPRIYYLPHRITHNELDRPVLRLVWVAQWIAYT